MEPSVSFDRSPDLLLAQSHACRTDPAALELRSALKNSKALLNTYLRFDPRSLTPAKAELKDGVRIQELKNWLDYLKR